MTDDPHLKTARVGAHWARRGITVAWVSGALNFLVICTALFIPYFQGIIDETRAEREYAEVKKLIMTDALHAIEQVDLAELIGDFRSVGEGARDEKNRAVMKAVVTTMSRRFGRMAQSISDEYVAYKLDYKLRSGIEILRDFIGAASGYVESAWVTSS